MTRAASARSLRMVIVGDSMLSGQGLREEHKIHRRVQEGLSGRHRELEVDSTLLAHSGAILGITPCESVLLPAPHVEVPIPQPTVNQQAASLAGSLESVDLLLVNGGAVDTNLLLVMNPFVGTKKLAPRIDRVFRMDLRVVLGRLAVECPAASIIVVPYYPVITEESNLELLGPFLAAHGVLHSASGRTLTPLLAKWIRRRVAVNCALFATRSAAGMRDAAAAVNAAVGGKRVSVADPPAVRNHAALTPDAWLFGINPDMTPQDEMAGERKSACRCQVRPGLNRARCFRASAGHLNPTGAAEYADSILRSIQNRPEYEGLA